MDLAEIQQLILRIAGPKTGQHPGPLLPKARALIEELNSPTTTIFPEDQNVLFTICGKIDKESNATVAWSLVSDIMHNDSLKSAPAYLNELRLAVAYNLRSSTIAYYRIDTGDLATGILLKIGDRYLVATTAHSTPARPPGKISFVKSTATSLNEPSSILSYAKESDYRLRDVAFMEVESSFESEFDKTALPLSRVSISGTGKANHLTFVVGYPSKLATSQTHSESDRRVDTISLRLECWCNTPLDQENWFLLREGRRTPDPELDIFIARQIERGSNLVEPVGMSGGGYWQTLRPSTEDGIWTPDSYSLIGIQSHWWSLGRYLQGTQIIHWLRLVYDRIPELQPLISAQFPDENF